MGTSTIHTGTVIWFNPKLGYGFLALDGETEPRILAHFSEIEGEGFRTLKTGQRVSFRVEETERGRLAKSVRVLK